MSLPSGQRTQAFGVPGVASPLDLYFVGPNTQNPPRTYNTRSSDLVNQQLNPPNSQNSQPETHTCVTCARSFSTKTGLGVHMRKAHPADLDRMRLRVDIKARWSEEEILLLARKEAELTVNGGSRFMNQDLSRIFPNRSLEAIKKARQKTSYRDVVRNYIDEIEAGPSHLAPATISASEPPLPNPNEDFLNYLLNQPPPTAQSYNIGTLQRIIDEANTFGKDTTFSRLSSYLLDVWPIGDRTPRPRRVAPSNLPRNRRQQRRREYALTQINWAKHQGRCIKSILEPNQSEIPPRSVMEPFWKRIMEQECNAAPPNENLSQSLESIWSPISLEEVEQHKLPLTTSPGPDGITSRQLRAIPSEILMRIFNLILWCGRLPQHLSLAKTIFIPKKINAIDPGDFRPITVPSVVVRLLHSILANRLRNALSLDIRQRAFISADGCADNITLIDLLLRSHHERHASCFIASLDVSKAFDSVSHNTIFGTMESYGVPGGFVQYLREFYKNSHTRLIGEDWMSSSVNPKRGVKQGDPLSPIIFNIIIDRLLKSLPVDIGCLIGSTKTNAIAFADDLVLCASTPQGLQNLIDVTQSYLTSCGMTLNSSKCLTISVKGQPKQKITVIEERTFKIGDNTIPPLKRGDEWKYLGVSFTADGKCKYVPSQELRPKLDRLSRAPLKPQQRLHALRVVLIPQLYHKLTLGNTMIGSLNTTDKIIRSAVRKWLNLPKDTPIAFFHAPIEHGGLGIPSLRWHAPLMRKERLKRLELPNLEEVAVANTFLATEIDKAERRLRIEGRLLDKRGDISQYWSDKLHSSVDGFGLRESGRHKQAHRWLREPSKLLSGRDFINCVRVRINALPSRSRTTRGRHEMDRSCRAGCGVPETLNHIVQQCHRTHRSRIDRHNSVVTYVERNLQNKGYTTIQEPHLRTTEGLRKPDLIATTGREAVVLDAQVVTDSRSLDEAHQRKLAYYNTPEIKRMVRERYNVDNVTCTTATLNWRGIWSGSSVDQLIAHKILSKKDTALISTRVAIGSVRSFRIFNSTTSVNYRTGVG